MKKTIIAISVATAFASIDASAFTLPAGAVLSIEAPSNFKMGGAITYTAGCTEVGQVFLFGDGSTANSGKGLFVGPNMGSISSGPHPGVPTPADRGGVTDMWDFFGNTGVNWMSQIVGSGNFGGDTTAGVDMSSWIVSWSTLEVIPMGGCQFGDPALNAGFSGCDTNRDGADDMFNTGVGALTWDGTNGGTYSIVHAANVPAGDPSGFAGVPYDVCLTGTVTFPGSLPANANAPTANDDSGFELGTDSTGNIINVRRNDTDPEINDAPDFAAIDLDTATPGIQTTGVTTLGGVVTVDPLTGVIYDAPGSGVKGADSFTYTIGDFRGGSGQSNIATVSFDVVDKLPVCVDDGIPQGAFIDLTIGQTFVNIDVTANDIDGDFPIAFPFMQIIDAPANGTATHLTTDGIALYTPNPGFIGKDTFTYTAPQFNPVAGEFQSCIAATVSVTVSNAGTPVGPFLLLKAGTVPSSTSKPPLGNGSYFTMELSPDKLTYTAVVGFNDIEIGTTQPGLSPNGPNIDEPWAFFGQLGLHQTTGALLQLSNDDAGNVELDFSSWNVSWNGIPSINMGSLKGGGPDSGVATLSCFTDLLAATPGTCAEGDEFLLTYEATVPNGDPSGFGNVEYTVHFEGTVSSKAAVLGCDNGTAFNIATAAVIDDCAASTPLSLTPGTTAASVNNTTGIHLTRGDINNKDPLINPADGKQCIGGCLDFVVNGVVNDHIDLVVRLNKPIPAGTKYRKLLNGVWHDFDTSRGDAVGSAPLDAVTGNCQSPEGSYKPGLRTGNQCLFLRIFDGGPNDADGLVNGTIVDPSGIALTGSPNVPAASSSGCSISNTPLTITERADWMIVAGFIALFGWLSFKRRRLNS